MTGWPARIYRQLLRLYPAPFRRRYGAELVIAFDQGFAEACAAGARSGVARFLVGAYVGALKNGLAERFTGPGTTPFRGWTADVRVAFRAIRGGPWFAATVAAVVLVTVAMSALVFMVLDGTLLRPLPYREPSDLVVIWGRNAVNGQLRDVISGSNAIDLQRADRNFDGIAALKPDDVVVLADGRPSVVATLTVSWNFFDVLGVEAARGRSFELADGNSGAEPVAMITDAAWRGRFRAAEDIVGRRVETTSGFVTVSGVLPQDFYFLSPAEFFVPLHDDVLVTYNRTSYDYWLIGRLRPGSSLEQANGELEAIMATIRIEDPRLSGWSVAVESLQRTAGEAVRPVLVALAVAVAALVVVAMANIASLFVIHANRLRGQVAVQSALGASRWRIVRRLATEVAIINGAGGLAGTLIAAVAVDLLPAVIPPMVPIPGSAAQITSFQATFDVRAMAFALFATVIVASAGLLPVAATASLREPERALRRAARTQAGSRKLRVVHDLFVAAQIAFATLLLVVGGLAVLTVSNLIQVDTGLQTGQVLTLYAGELDDADSTQRAAYFREILTRVEALPGVAAVGVNDYVPLQAEDDFEGITFPDRPPPPPGQGIREEWRRVSEGYFEAAGVDLVAGRGFRRTDFGPVPEDESGPGVAIVNESFVRRHFPEGDVVGSRIVIHEGDYGDATIIGVVRDVLRRGLREAAPPVLYVPYDRHPRPIMAVFVRTAGPASDWIEPVRTAIWSIDPHQPIDRVATLEQVVSNALGVPRFGKDALVILAATAIILATLGVFGVLGYSVRLRHRELGVRMALGATGATLQRRVAGRGVALSALGAFAGLALSLMVARAAGSLLFGVRAGDPALLAVVATIVVGAAALASWLPARSVAKIDPASALTPD